VAGARLYGSRARASHDGYSDADLAVLLKGPRSNATSVGVDMAGLHSTCCLIRKSLSRRYRFGRRNARIRNPIPIRVCWKPFGATGLTFEGGRVQPQSNQVAVRR